jgi:hypothetical protein
MSNNQTAIKDALNVLYDQQGAAFAAGYMSVMIRDMMQSLPKKKQQEFLLQVLEHNGRQRNPFRTLGVNNEA